VDSMVQIALKLQFEGSVAIAILGSLVRETTHMAGIESCF
jgi:hypothetical protein